MVDLTNAKKRSNSHAVDGAIESQGLYDRNEPLLSPTVLKERFLFGIPMRSPMSHEEISPRMLKDFIKRGVARVETDIKTSVMPTFYRERLPFDPFLYQKNMWFEVPIKPIQKVTRLAICSASYSDTLQENKDAPYPSGSEIFQIPPAWVDMSYASHGKIFVNPLNPSYAGISGSSSSAVGSGGSIIQFVNFGGWIPAFWTVEFIGGIATEEGLLPVMLNELIGQAASILILDNLIPLYRIASQSLGIDGLSQSVNDLGYQLLTQKRQALLEEYDKGYRKIKQKYNNSFFVSNI